MSNTSVMEFSEWVGEQWVLDREAGRVEQAEHLKIPFRIFSFFFFFNI